MVLVIKWLLFANILSLNKPRPNKKETFHVMEINIIYGIVHIGSDWAFVFSCFRINNFHFDKYFPKLDPVTDVTCIIFFSLLSVKLRICQKPPEPGNCGARWVRWYFNTHIQKCSWFYFQGCNGNENNFRSKTECQAECMPNQQTNIIQKPIIYGLDGPMVVMQPMNNQPDYSNHISKGSFPSVRSKPINNQDRELRRKRRLERRRQKRLRKLMRKRRKSMRGRKRRREGKSKLKGKSRKKRKNKKKKKGKRGKKKKSKPKGEKTTIKIIPGEGDDIKNTKDLVDKLVAQETLKGKKKELKKDSKSWQY